jgi:hypothetical protein
MSAAEDTTTPATEETKPKTEEVAEPEESTATFQPVVSRMTLFYVQQVAHLAWLQTISSFTSTIPLAKDIGSEVVELYVPKTIAKLLLMIMALETGRGHS